ncbi:MAG: CotH kinase family protein [Flavobacteriales bacterium]|nr:CotH kinase family protein [Flavobacteriales bacterium]
MSSGLSINIKLSFLLLLIFVTGSCKKKSDLDENNYSIPVVKLTLNENHLWSTDSGLYVIGTNGITYGCSQLANYNQKWEFPAHIEYKENGIIGFSDDVGFRIKGKCSRNNSMKSIGIYWRSKYGNKKLEYPIFSSNTSTYKRLFLRNSGNDFGKTQIKDASISMIFKNYANVEFQEYKPAVLYLNDEYWGIYNLREMITPHHFKYKYGVTKSEVEILEGCELSPKADDGSINDFMTEVIDFISENNLSDNQNYQVISNLIDIDSYMDYIIINTYIFNSDWPCGNAKWWREPTSSDYEKWKWIVYDTDFAFKKENVSKIWIGNLYGNTISLDKANGFFIFNNLIKNDDFLQLFLNRYLYFIDVVFVKNRVKTIIKENQNLIESEYINHQNKWNTLPERKWNNSVNEMIEFNDTRNAIMRTAIKKLQK